MNEHLEDIDLIDEYSKDQYQEVDVEVVGHSDKAILVEGDIWLPKSRVRIDFEENLYIENWLYAKHF